jgi:hypothetical protein
MQANATCLRACSIWVTAHNGFGICDWSRKGCPGLFTINLYACAFRSCRSCASAAFVRSHKRKRHKRNRERTVCDSAMVQAQATLRGHVTARPDTQSPSRVALVPDCAH